MLLTDNSVIVVLVLLCKQACSFTVFVNILEKPYHLGLLCVQVCCRASKCINTLQVKVQVYGTRFRLTL